VWSIVGSSVLLIVMAVLKRRWKVVDQRRSSNKTLRKVAKVYQDAYRKQDAFLEQLATDVKSAFEHRADSPEYFNFVMLQVQTRLSAMPDFLEIARREQKEDVDSIVIPEGPDEEEPEKE